MGVNAWRTVEGGFKYRPTTGGMTKEQENTKKELDRVGIGKKAHKNSKEEVSSTETENG